MAIQLFLGGGQKCSSDRLSGTQHMAAAANVSSSWALKVKVGKKQEPQTDILTLPAPAQRWILEAKGDPTDIFHHQIISHQEEVTSKVADKGSSACICPGLNVSGRKKLVCARVRVCVYVCVPAYLCARWQEERESGRKRGRCVGCDKQQWVGEDKSELSYWETVRRWEEEKNKKSFEKSRCN